MIRIIVACDQNNLIGTDKTANQIPWHNQEDFLHFKNTTLNKTLLMGRKTFEAIGKPLPKRHTYVLTKNLHVSNFDNVTYVDDLVQVIQRCREENIDLYICGGASVYKQAFSLCDEILLSRIPGEYVGDTWLEDFSEWYELDHIENRETFDLEVYKRRKHD